MKLSDKVKTGDLLLVKNQRGSDWQLEVLEINDEKQTALLGVKKVRPNMGNSWFYVEIPEKGRPYAEN